MEIFADRIAALGTENAFKIGDDIKACERMGMEVIRLNLGEPDFNSPQGINEVGMEQINIGNSHYTDPAGIEPLRRAIAAEVGETRGITVDPEQVVVTSGAKPPISYTMLSYVNPGDEVIYPSPGFPIYESWVTFLGATPVPLHLEEEKGFRFDAADLEKLISPRTRLLMINSPSNPTGGVLTRDDLEETAALVRDRCDERVRIYSDEVYEYIIFDGLTHQSIISVPGMRERTVLVSGHSKTYAMTGWRLGYAVLPTLEEARLFRQLNINTISCTPPFIQEAGRAAIEDEANKAIVGEMRRQFEERRNYVVKALNEIDGITCAMPQGAFYVFPNIGGVCEKLGVLGFYASLPPDKAARTSPSTMFLMFLLYRYGVATMDRRSFGVIGSEGKHFLRLSTATKMDLLKRGIEKIAEASGDRKGFEQFAQEGEHLSF